MSAICGDTPVCDAFTAFNGMNQYPRTLQTLKNNIHFL